MSKTFVRGEYLNSELRKRNEYLEAERDRLQMQIEVIHGAALGDPGVVAEHYKTSALTAVMGLRAELAILRSEVERLTERHPSVACEEWHFKDAAGLRTLNMQYITTIREYNAELMRLRDDIATKSALLSALAEGCLAPGFLGGSSRGTRR